MCKFAKYGVQTTSLINSVKLVPCFFCSANVVGLLDNQPEINITFITVNLRYHNLG